MDVTLKQHAHKIMRYTHILHYTRIIMLWHYTRVLCVVYGTVAACVYVLCCVVRYGVFVCVRRARCVAICVVYSIRTICSTAVCLCQIVFSGAIRSVRRMQTNSLTDKHKHTLTRGHKHKYKQSFYFRIPH